AASLGAAPSLCARSIRVMLRVLLLTLPLLSVACGPPTPAPNAAAPALSVPPPSAIERVWETRPRVWDRLRVGLTHLPERLPLTMKPEGPARMVDGTTRQVLARIKAGRAPPPIPGPGGGPAGRPEGAPREAGEPRPGAPNRPP